MWLTDRAGYTGEPVRFLVRKVPGLALMYHCWHLQFLSFYPGPYRSFKKLINLLLVTENNDAKPPFFCTTKQSCYKMDKYEKEEKTIPYPNLTSHNCFELLKCPGVRNTVRHTLGKLKLVGFCEAELAWFA